MVGPLLGSLRRPKSAMRMVSIRSHSRVESQLTEAVRPSPSLMSTMIPILSTARTLALLTVICTCLICNLVYLIQCLQRLPKTVAPIIPPATKQLIMVTTKRLLSTWNGPMQ